MQVFIDTFPTRMVLYSQNDTIPPNIQEPYHPRADIYNAIGFTYVLTRQPRRTNAYCHDQTLFANTALDYVIYSTIPSHSALFGFCFVDRYPVYILATGLAYESVVFFSAPYLPTYLFRLFQGAVASPLSILLVQCKVIHSAWSL
jgi:hypothetical protein